MAHLLAAEYKTPTQFLQSSNANITMLPWRCYVVADAVWNSIPASFSRCTCCPSQVSRNPEKPRSHKANRVFMHVLCASAGTADGFLRRAFTHAGDVGMNRRLGYSGGLKIFSGEITDPALVG